MKTEKTKIKSIKIPAGCFCGHNCGNDCRYYYPNKKDFNGRAYCSHYESYYYPWERQGCQSYKS